MIKVRYFGEDGMPVLHKDGNAGWDSEYDSFGNMTKVLYYGVDNKITLLKDGYASVRCEYDEHGNQTKKSYYGVDNRLTHNIKGYAESRAEYDSRGNCVKILYYGTDGKPRMCLDGYASQYITYNDKDVAINWEFFDENGEKIMPTRVVVSGRIVLNSAAALKGVKEGDVWCRLGAYDITKTSNVLDVIKPMQVARNEEKTLVVARKVEDVYKIYSFQFPVGLMGIEIADKVIHDYGKLIKAYKAYCEQEGKR